MFSNISLLLTFGAYLALVQFSKTKPPSGDYAVGHAWVLLLIGFALFVTSLLATVAINLKGGFAWVPGQGLSRKLLLAIGWLAFCASTLICANLPWKSSPSATRWVHPARIS